MFQRRKWFLQIISLCLGKYVQTFRLPSPPPSCLPPYLSNGKVGAGNGLGPMEGRTGRAGSPTGNVPGRHYCLPLALAANTVLHDPHNLLADVAAPGGGYRRPPLCGVPLSLSLPCPPSRSLTCSTWRLLRGLWAPTSLACCWPLGVRAVCATR